MTRPSPLVFMLLMGLATARPSAGAIPATDDFERHSLGPNWTVLAGSGSMGIVSNSDLGLIQGPARGGAVAWAADLFPADQYSDAVLAGDRPDSMLTQIFLRLRPSDGARYGFHWNDGFGGRWEIKYDGVPTSQTRILASIVGPEPLPGDRLRAEITGQTIRCFLNGALLLSATDTEPQAITTPGQPGMVFRFTTTFPGVYPATAFEEWSGGSLAVASVNEVPVALQGFVRTDTGTPIAAARVTLATLDTSQVLETRSAPDGRYEFPSVASGTWSIGASRPGRAYAETLRIVGGADLTQDFALPPDTHPGRWSVIGNTDPENLYATDSGSLLPDGRIFYCHDTIDPLIFDPRTGAKFFPPASPSMQGCHVTTLLADGRLIFVGGQDTGDFRDAVRTVKTYDIATNQWTVLPSMMEERWYAGLVRLADGRLLVMGGGQRPNAQRTPTCEVYDPTDPDWTATSPMSNPSDFPPSVLLYNGKVLRSWWPPQLYDVTAGTWTTTGPMVQTNRFWPGHCDHSLVLLPDGRACAVGIYRGTLTNPSMVELYDPAAQTWSLGANAAVTRSQPEVVMLPTGQVFVAGGRLEDPNHPAPTNEWNQTRLTDLYDAASNSWRRCADMKWFREYHAVTVLVPDGRVVTTAGTGGPAQPGVSNEVEAFEPPYLFRGIRPRIDAISSATLKSGGSLELDVSRTDSVTSVVLVGTNAVTHWVDGGVPRVIGLAFEQAGGMLRVAVPADQNRAPVGYYTLFVMVDDIPSAGVIVRIIPGGSAGVPGDITPRTLLKIRAQPNPSRFLTRIAWYQATGGEVRFRVLDPAGCAVWTARREEGPGWHDLEWSGSAWGGRDVPPGLYWVEAKSASARSVAQVVRIGP